MEIKLANNKRGCIITTFAFIKRSSIIFILLFVTHLFGQETIIPLAKGGWVGGLSGNVSWDDYKINNSQVDGFNFSVSSRNGRFVMDDLSVGFDFQWKEKELAFQNQKTEFERHGFIGLWMRYYVPFFGTSLAMYPEASVGYGNYKSETRHSNAHWNIHNLTTADGFAYNVGLGITQFISNTISFEITGRYQGGTLSGTGPNNDEYSYKSKSNIEIELSNIDILFGIMIYLK